MAHLYLGEGPGGPRPPLRDGSGSLNIPHTAGSIPARRDSTPATHRPELATRLPRHIPEPSSPRSTTMKFNARPLVAGVGCPSTHLDPCRSSQQTMSRDIQPKDRQVRRVYKRSNSAGKPPFLATFGDSRRSFQVAILAQHVVAAT